MSINIDENKVNLSRRKALKYGVGFLGTGSLAIWLGKDALAQNIPNSIEIATDTSHHGPTSNLTPDEALKKLLEGNQRFVDEKKLHPDQDLIRVASLAEGQAPFAAILSCADSRVVPEIAFDQGLGSLFVVRVAGNISPIEDIASEEYAVGVLGAPLLMVLGHENCGAVKATIQGGEYSGVIDSLIYALKPAVEASERMPGDQVANAIKTNVKLQVNRLLTSSVISNAVKEGKLKVVGAYYELTTGKVSLI